jgi:hypothetical protein
MDGMAYQQVSSPLPGAELHVRGPQRLRPGSASDARCGAAQVNADLRFKQLTPLNVQRERRLASASVTGRTLAEARDVRARAGKRTVYEAPVLPAANMTSIAAVQFPPLIKGYFARNGSAAWAGAAAATAASECVRAHAPLPRRTETIELDAPLSYWQSGAETEFRLFFNLRVPPQPVRQPPAGPARARHPITRRRRADTCPSGPRCSSLALYSTPPSSRWCTSSWTGRAASCSASACSTRTSRTFRRQSH